MNNDKKERRQAQLAKKAETLKEYASEVKITGKNELTIDGRPYLLVRNYRDGFQSEKLEERFSQILTKYDYIVGDWGFDQLRLHGFYEDPQHKGLPSQSISHLQDYLYEYCNFGCAYFVLKNLDVVVPNKHPRHRKKDDQRLAGKKGAKKSRTDNPAENRPAFAMHQRRNKTAVDSKFTVSAVKTKNIRKRHFTIRQKNSK
jgi:uncharacterized protein YutD